MIDTDGVDRDCEGRSVLGRRDDFGAKGGSCDGGHLRGGNDPPYRGHDCSIDESMASPLSRALTSLKRWRPNWRVKKVSLLYEG